MKRIRYIACLFLLFGVASSAYAANFHIRVGAGGSNNGSDWTNAWTGFSSISWGSVNPGDTLYIAAGTYGGVTVPESGMISAPITFKRATIAVHGSVTGWSNAYDGQVIMDGAGAQGTINIGDQHDLTFDGVTRYGIRIVDGFHGVRGTAGNNNSNLTLRYLEIGGTGSDKMDEDGVQGSGDNFLMEYCWIHDNDDLTNHGDGVQWYEADGMTVRYNLFQNNGQVMMLTENAFGPTQLVNDLDFSYNVIANRSGAHYNGLSKKFCPAVGRFWNIYNNTWDAFLDQGTNFEDDILGGAGSCTRMFFRNNAFIRTRMNSISSTTHNNNGYDNTDPLAVYNGNSIVVPTETGRVSAADLGFTDVAAINYHLLSGSALINAGTNVGLSQDFDGNPIIGNPDIGAFEFGAAVATAGVKYSLAIRNAQLNAIETVVGPNPVLRLCGGALPATVAAPDGGTSFAKITLPSDWATPAVGGVIGKNGAWTGLAKRTGTATHWRLYSADGTTHMQASISASAGSGIITMPSTSVVAGTIVRINTFTIRDVNEFGFVPSAVDRLQYSTAVNNAKMDSILPLVGPSPTFKLISGAEPISVATPDTGSTVSSLALPTVWLGPSVSGVVSKLGTWQGTATLTGVVPTHFRIESNPSTPQIQAEVTPTGGGGVATISNTNVVAGDTVQVSTFTLNSGNQ